MNSKVVVVIVIVAAVLVGLPLVAKYAKESEAGGSGGGGDSGKSAANVPNDPPLLNATNLVNSKWSVSIEGIQAEITLLAGGKASAKHNLPMPMIPNPLEGTWSVSGAKLTVTASAMGQSRTVDIHISGNDLYADGNKVTRVQ